jgi:hypothetical protein
MELETLREQSNVKGLMRGRSSVGKTYNASRVALEILDAGGSVLYVDTESDGSTTLVNVVEREYEPGVVSDLDYRRVGSYEGLVESIEDGEDFDLVVVDTLDHKHSYVLKHVTDAKIESGADWNQYPHIYAQEKEFMRQLTSLDTNVLACVDPESGSSDKPKGAQTNVHGYFNIVIDLFRNDGERSHRVENFVGREDIIGGKMSNVEVWEALSETFEKRMAVRLEM